MAAGALVVLWWCFAAKTVDPTDGTNAATSLTMLHRQSDSVEQNTVSLTLVSHPAATTFSQTLIKIGAATRLLVDLV